MANDEWLMTNATGSGLVDRVSNGGPIVSDRLVQPLRDLSKRTMFHRFDELSEDIAAFFRHRAECIESTGGGFAVAPFELGESFHLPLLLAPGGAHYMFRGQMLDLIRETIQADNRPGAIVDLLLVTMRGSLDLRALVTMFHRGQHAAQTIQLAEFVEDPILHGAFDDLHPGRP